MTSSIFSRPGRLFPGGGFFMCRCARGDRSGSGRFILGMAHESIALFGIMVSLPQIGKEDEKPGIPAAAATKMR